MIMTQTDRKQYVLGLVWRALDSTSVLVVQKKRPEWQAGRYNGPGGKVEFGEDVLTAMQRELYEEAGVLCPQAEMRHFATLWNGTWEVHCVAVVIPTALLADVATKTDEEVRWVDRKELYYQSFLPNLRWLVPLAQDRTLAGIIRIQDTYP